MPIEPRVEIRAEQPYVAVRRAVTLATFPEIADRLPGVIAHLGERGVAPAGAPFFRYEVIDMDRRLVVQAGVPVAAGVSGDDLVFADVLPAGRYVTATHVGPPDRLVGATAALLEWAAGQGLTWDVEETEEGERWGCRLERLLTDPAEEPDPARWRTELAFRLAG